MGIKIWDFIVCSKTSINPLHLMLFILDSGMLFPYT